MQGSQEDPRQVPIGVDDDQKEVYEPEQAEGGEAEGASIESGARASDWNTRASGNKMLAEGASGQSPWKKPQAEGSGREGGQEDEQVDVKDIDLDGFAEAKNADVQGGGLEAGGGPSMEFERHWCFGPTCTTFRRTLNVVGAVAALANAAVDVIYAYRTRYVLATIFQLTCVFLVLRVLGTVAAGQYYYTKFVRNYRPSMGDVAEAKNVADEGEEEEAAEEDGHKRSKNYQEGVTLGQHLYSALHLLLYTGFFRLLPSRDFPYELAVGYALELFLSMVPMLFCMIFNNAETSDKTALQSAAMLLKVCSLLALLAELILMIWEVSLNRRQAKLGFANSKKLSEEQRRREWGKKLSWVAVVSMATFIVILLVGVLATSARECGPRQALSSATCVDCEDPQCSDCSGDPAVCLGGCDRGHYLAADQTCARCDGLPKDSDALLSCLKCTAGAAKPECTKCAPGHGLEGGKCQTCMHSAIRRAYTKREDGKACRQVRPEHAVQGVESEAACGDALKDLGTTGSNCKNTKGHFTYNGQTCACCDPGDGANLINNPESALYKYNTYPGEPQKEVDDDVNTQVAAGEPDVFCKSCDGSDTAVCKVCSEGSRKRDGFCVPCRESMPHCAKCADGQVDKCGKCDYQVAEMDDAGKCTKCRTEGGWVKDEALGRCKCNQFINVFDGRKCQTCEQIIPGCSKCEQTDYIYGDQSKVLIGYDESIANEKRGKYVVCKACSSDSMFQITVTDSNGASQIACQKCGEIIPGCKKCTKTDGKDAPICAACTRNYYLVREGDDYKCVPCTKWGQSCQKCSIEGCSDCGQGYWSFMNSGICVKSWW